MGLMAHEYNKGVITSLFTNFNFLRMSISSVIGKIN